ncbi:pyridoxamine 5'-phosphate oxidase family protein [Paraburkholderia caribensis]|uniref:2Fe-2S iron-sulfur cluster-binding protein n=1 Tax=Paraburkholderia caribensis TaxID=75105 RepID=UPI0005657FDC|nr:pyridoxamine 5'-phosphate oxidase family protein [Paraburkholderia caribensis]
MNDFGKESDRSVWHAGELALQEKAGVADVMADVGRRVIREYMPDQHREFFEQLPFIIIGSVDDAGNVWSTIRTGRAGFVRSPTSKSLRICALADEVDPVSRGIEVGKAVGLLGIDLFTRRRNRMNGVVSHVDESGFEVAVGQSFGNCPSYIHRRVMHAVGDPEAVSASRPESSVRISAFCRSMIEAADTFFVATYADIDGKRQVDVSHRGGKPGFVRVDEDGTLTVPDFAGNSFFSTLGNILLNGKAGLVFANVSTGDLLQISGKAEVVVDSPEIAAFQGAERIWRFNPHTVTLRSGALALRWERKPEAITLGTEMTGDWIDAAAKLKANAYKGQWRKLRVAEIVDESTTVRSFHLEPMDDAGLQPFVAGQHLLIRLPSENQSPAVRTYTLSTAPSDNVYRISVKRGANVSRHLHEQLKVGDLLDTFGPSGSFTIDPMEQRPAVMLAAGIGITPLLAMLRHTVYEGWRKRQIRTTWIFYSARNVQDRAFNDELLHLASEAQGAISVVRCLTDVSNAIRRTDYEVSGRIDMDLVKASLPFDDYDFYICGPLDFMQSIFDGLRTLDVSENRIHYESFGAGDIRRDESLSDDGFAPKPLASKEVAVHFTRASVMSVWHPGESLLDIAEKSGLQVPYSCRSGHCGSCRTTIGLGSVTYTKRPEYQTDDNEALMCCAVPTAQCETTGIYIDL